MRTGALILLSCGWFGCGGFHVANPDDGGTDAGLDGGTSFTVVEGLPTGETLTSIWGADADHISAVGTNGLHKDFYDGAWHRAQVKLGLDYYAVWGASQTEVYAVGQSRGDGHGIISRSDGTGWKDEFISDKPLYGIWGDGTLVMAVGAGGEIYGKPVGASVSWAKRLSHPLPANPNVAAGADDPVLYGISGNNGNDFAIAAGTDRFFHYIGGGDFVNLDPYPDRTVEFRSVWQAPGSGVTSIFFGTNYLGVLWVTGSAPPGREMVAESSYILSQDRTRGNASSLYIRGIYGTTAKAIFVGDLGTIKVYDAATQGVQSVASPVTDASLSGVWGSSEKDVWIVGARELVLHGSF